MTVSAARTLEILTAYGADAVFNTDTTAYDPTTGLTTRTGPATHTHKVVEEGRVDRITGGAEILIYVSPSGMTFTPTGGGTVSYQGRTWTIVTVAPVVYQGNTVLYEIGLRGVTL